MIPRTLAALGALGAVLVAAFASAPRRSSEARATDGDVRGTSAQPKRRPTAVENAHDPKGAAFAGTCAADWPKASGESRRRASLKQGSPAILWRNAGVSGPVIVVGEHLIVTEVDTLKVLTLSGELRSTYRDPSHERLSAPVADLQGNIFVNRPSGVTSFDRNGHLRQRLDLYPPLPGHRERVTVGDPVLAPDGMLFAESYQGVLHAFDTGSLTVAWTLPLDNGILGLHGGAGRFLFANALDKNNANTVLVVDTATHALVGQLGDRSGAVGLAVGSRATAHGVLGIEAGIVGTSSDGKGFLGFDGCGTARGPLFHDSNQQIANLIGVGETILSVFASVDATSRVRTSRDQLVAYRSDGSRAVGPVTSEFPRADADGLQIPEFAGADGWLYTVTCESATAAQALVAYDASLRHQWQIELGTGCGAPPKGVLLDNGVLVLSGSGGLSAIQTGSPGLASSSWPTLRHDNRGTSWLSGLPGF